MIFGLIPAAGKSSRMGRPKLALPLGTKMVLEHVIDALRRAGVDLVLVVLGPHVAELAPLAAAVGAQSLLLPAETPDMRATVEAGLRWLEETHRPAAQDEWLLVPADHPTLDAAVVRQLLAADKPAGALLVPTYQGRRGHPTLLGWRRVPGLRAHPPGEGINAFLRRQQVVEWEVDSPEILVDLDTPEDYERLRRQFGQENDPGRRALR